jgi:hypothetical protein
MKPKFSAALSVLAVTIASLLPTPASGDSLDRGKVEQKLRADFNTAERIQVVSMEENYWGLYKNYAVTFNATFANGGTYKVSCNLVDRSSAGTSKNMQLNDCAATDPSGQHVDIAKVSGKDSSPRLPASH